MISVKEGEQRPKDNPITELINIVNNTPINILPLHIGKTHCFCTGI